MKRRSFLKGLPVTVAATMAVAKSVGQEPLGTYELGGKTYVGNPPYSEYDRVWREKLAEHKRELERSFLFGINSMEHKTAYGIIRIIEPYV